MTQEQVANRVRITTTWWVSAFENGEISEYNFPLIKQIISSLNGSKEIIEETQVELEIVHLIQAGVELASIGIGGQKIQDFDLSTKKIFYWPCVECKNCYLANSGSFF